ncbi:hypothetical protein [Pleionea sp. CnH1-48]|uniref:hypothetical protein n=1 Tax=Pleionea sp. CnH1-48 TaxID=2954494 RepID=UPI0020976E1B|nr:hypothetical protein [Pleionea sp. CnH1-48]MCO7227549.1 hypothetical protein [Pleionea sp. CnH1-48]
MSKIGQCKLCNEKEELQLSHAVGNSVFKKISRRNSGKVISITSGNEPVAYSNDSWAEHQLCSKCERLLNHEYEDYSLGVLRGRGGTFIKTDAGLSLRNINQHRLIMYFLSIYWRAANSAHPAYKNVLLAERESEFLRHAILNNSRVSSGKVSIKISRVLDLSKSKGFTSDAIKQLIVSPFLRINENYKENKVSVCFMFEGFFIEIFTKALSIKERRIHGVLSRTQTSLMVPYLNLFDIEEIVDLMVVGYGKHIDGNSRVK